MPLAHHPFRRVARLRRRRRRHERRRLPLARLAVLVTIVGAATVAPLADPPTAHGAAPPHEGRPAARRAVQPNEGPPPAHASTSPGHPSTAPADLPTGRGATAAPGDGPPVVVSYVPPVDAPVVDAFRPPALPWASGNRGLEYDTSPGDPVRASAAGVVTFAGQVGGSLHVTVLHPDGLRTGYSFLAGVLVAQGQAVRQGDLVGRAGDAFHFAARVGDAYVDPAALFDTGATIVELLPFEVPPGAGPDRLDVVDRAFRRGAAGLAEGVRGLDQAYDWLGERVGVLGSVLRDTHAGYRWMSLALDLGERLAFPGPCSVGPPPPRPVRGSHRVAITVAGLGSSSTDASVAALRTPELGYDDGDVLRFSYRGGVVPSAAAAAERFGVAARPYSSADTQDDLATAAARLADLVERVLAADPSATVDLVAHSQGGLVTRLALDELQGRGTDLGRLGLVATLGSPHRGADLATAIDLAGSRPSRSLALALGGRLAGTSLDPGAAVIGQLSERSGVVASLARADLPDGVRMVSIAARGDLVVASPNTRVAGATNVTVAVDGVHAHSALVGSDAATDELARALAGEPPGCESAGDVVRDVVTGHAVSAVEDATGVAALATVP